MLIYFTSVKARNRLDGRIYAVWFKCNFFILLLNLHIKVKKIKILQSSRDDEKIFREVKLLSRLQHRHIVRYYTTWLESPEGLVSESEESSDADDPFTINIGSLKTNSRSQSTSFPTIHFTQDNSGHLSSLDDSDNDSDDDESGSLSPALSRYTEKPSMSSHRILYIQMVRATVHLPGTSFNISYFFF